MEASTLILREGKKKRQKTPDIKVYQYVHLVQSGKKSRIVPHTVFYMSETAYFTQVPQMH